MSPAQRHASGRPMLLRPQGPCNINNDSNAPDRSVMPHPIRSLINTLRARGFASGGAVDAGETAIIWWGSLRSGGGATIGDLRAVENLSAELSARGHPHTVLTNHALPVSGHLAIDDLRSVGTGIETIVFVCGPLVEHRRLIEFLARQRSARKIAVGVSVLSNQRRMTEQFDLVLARDGLGRQSFDLAISSTRRCEPPTPGRLKLALCYRGNQKEYGKGRADAARAESLLDGLASEMQADVIRIDTVLRLGNGADDIEEKFRSADIVLTTRLHGALFALANGKPVVAIDQIRGNGKVKPVLDRLGWPAAFGVEQVEPTRLYETVAAMLREWPIEAVSAVQARIASEAKAAIGDAADLVMGTQVRER